MIFMMSLLFVGWVACRVNGRARDVFLGETHDQARAREKPGTGGSRASHAHDFSFDAAINESDNAHHVVGVPTELPVRR
jgi:hypothetical protein